MDGSISHVTLLGFNNGTIGGPSGLVLTLGFGIGEAANIVPGPFRYTALGTHQPGASATGTHQPGASAAEAL
jgi:hypothetical protein